ncbi:hypothetical protein [Metabacillus fastidiosus]|uniref:hypothetical protein n=1 Tax=Metabacillus fastidiosus TaxID=1458 RepID=UPI003D2AE1F4
MDTYGTIEIAVKMNNVTMEEAFKQLNGYNIKDMELIIKTTNDRKIVFNTEDATINDANPDWESEFDDENDDED